MIPAVVSAVDDELAGVEAYRREQFDLRLARWWDDLRSGVAEVYPEPDRLLVAVVRSAAAAFRRRDPELLRLDQARTLDPGWFQSPRMVGYAAYADRFAGDLAGVRDRIGYLRELGVTYLHLMPLLRPRDGDSDGGYAVADYRSVRPDLGTMDDLRELAAALRAAGISLVLDLVLNHVAREHEWAVAARAGSARHRAYFRVFPDRSGPDSFEATLPEVFPDFAPGNFTWDDDLAGWVWTTFNSFQWDVDWSNPDVFAEYADLLLYLANHGVEVFRLDAIAFLWKRVGTDCQNQPEVHAITQALRALMRIACPAVAFKAEAIVGPGDLAAYLGSGRHHGKVSDLAYHNSLMVQIWSTLAAGDARLAARALGALPAVPASTAWITYLRCHDDIGWAVSDADAAAVGLDGFAHRSFLSDWYTGSFPGSPARGLVFQANPTTGDRRVSGTAASLVGPSPDRLLLGYTIVYGWGGVPVIWSGDELAQPNDPDWASEPGHEADNRWAHRPRLDAARVASRSDPATVAGRVFASLRRLAAVRASLPHLHASVASEVLPPGDQGVLAVLRRHPVGPMLQLYNVTGEPRPWPGRRLAECGLSGARDVLGDFPVPAVGDLWLPPYARLWLVRTPVGGSSTPGPASGSTGWCGPPPRRPG